jgi:hypothetical protein
MSDLNTADREVREIRRERRDGETVRGDLNGLIILRRFPSSI